MGSLCRKFAILTHYCMLNFIISPRGITYTVLKKLCYFAVYFHLLRMNITNAFKTGITIKRKPFFSLSFTFSNRYSTMKHNAILNDRQPSRLGRSVVAFSSQIDQNIQSPPVFEELVQIATNLVYWAIIVTRLYPVFFLASQTM